MFGPEYTPEQGEKALRDLHSQKRTALDRVLLGILFTILLSGVAVLLLGVYALGAAIL